MQLEKFSIPTIHYFFSESLEKEDFNLKRYIFYSDIHFNDMKY